MPSNAVPHIWRKLSWVSVDQAAGVETDSKGQPLGPEAQIQDLHITCTPQPLPVGSVPPTSELLLMAMCYRHGEEAQNGN